MMKILLVGANGFIGSNIRTTLARYGLTIFVYDRTGNVPLKASDGFAHLSHAQLFGISPPNLDAIVSVAGTGDPAACEADPQTQLRAEYGLAELLSKAAVRVGAKKIVQLSSAGAIYGEGWRGNIGASIAFDERSDCLPMSAYGRIKLAAEQELLRASTSTPSVTILRASNVYGLHYSKGGRQGVINAVAERALKNEPISIFGDGLVYRDYIFSGDLASAIRCALARDSAGIYNIARGQSHSILDIVDRLEETLKRKIARTFEPARAFDVRYSALSIARAQQYLLWKPQVDLAEGLAAVTRHLTEQLLLSNIG